MAKLVRSVSRHDEHAFSKQAVDEIELVAGLGVVGDAHYGATVKHRSRVRADPTQPNLRQVHLIQAELFDEMAVFDFDLSPGDLGENILTEGIDLLALPTASTLRIGDDVLLCLTGLRNPCGQIEGFSPGLLRHVSQRSSDGRTIRKAGVMAVVINGGVVRPGDSVEVALPPQPHKQMERV